MKEQLQQLLQNFFNEERGNRITAFNFNMLTLMIMEVVDRHKDGSGDIPPGNKEKKE